MSDDRRGKKSFSELDKERRERKHGRDDRERSGGDFGRDGHAYRTYKEQLNKVFDGGGLPDALKEKLAGTGVAEATASKVAALKTLREASSPSALLEALASYRAEHDFPRDEAILSRLLEIEDEPEIILAALETIDAMHDAGQLKRAAALKMRIKTAQMTVDDDDVVARAKGLLRKL